MKSEFTWFTNITSLLINDSTFAIDESRMEKFTRIIAMSFDFPMTDWARNIFLLTKFKFDHDRIIRLWNRSDGV